MKCRLSLKYEVGKAFATLCFLERILHLDNGSGESSLISGLRVTLDRHRKQTSCSCSSVMSGNDHSKLREAPQRQLSCGRLLTAASHQNRFISHALDSFQTAACCSELAPVLLRTLNLASHYQCIMAVFFLLFFSSGLSHFGLWRPS